jgi:hypothetical protein
MSVIENLRRTAVAGGLLAALAAAPLAAHEPHHTVVPADAVTWGPAPPSLPPGAQAAVLLGSPAKEGPFVLRLKFPPGYIVPPHRHTKDEMVTVIALRDGRGRDDRADQRCGAVRRDLHRSARRPAPHGAVGTRTARGNARRPSPTRVAAGGVIGHEVGKRQSR